MCEKENERGKRERSESKLERKWIAVLRVRLSPRMSALVVSINRREIRWPSVLRYALNVDAQELF